MKKCKWKLIEGLKDVSLTLKNGEVIKGKLALAHRNGDFKVILVYTSYTTRETPRGKEFIYTSKQINVSDIKKADKKLASIIKRLK